MFPHVPPRAILQRLRAGGSADMAAMLLLDYVPTEDTPAVDGASSLRGVQKIHSAQNPALSMRYTAGKAVVVVGAIFV